MSKYDKEREKLGLSKVGSASSVSTDKKSKYALERAALSDQSLKKAAENQQYSNAMKSSRVMEIDNLNAQHEKERTEKELIKDNDVNWKSWAVPDASGNKLSLGLGPINQDKYNAQVDLMNRNGTIGPDIPNNFALDDVMNAFQHNDAEAMKRLEASRWKDMTQAEQTQLRNMALERNSELSRLNSDSRIATDLRKFADTTKPIADIGMSLYTPGAGLGVLQGATRGAEALVAKVAPKLAGSALGRIGQVAASEAIVGAPTAVGQTLTQNPDASGRELLTSAAYGAGGGAALGGLGKAIGEGIRGLRGLRGSADNLDSEAVQGVTRTANDEVVQLPQSVRRAVTNESPVATQEAVQGSQNVAESLPTQPIRQSTRTPRKVGERGFVRTLEQSGKLTDDVEKGLKQSADRNYTPITNEGTVQAANQRISQGIDSAEATLLGKSKYTAEDVATGMRLIDELQRTGNTQRAVTIAENLSKQLTEAGQTVQAASIWNRLTPEGALLAAQRKVDRINDNLLKGQKPVKISQEQAQDIMDSAGAIQAAGASQERAGTVMEIMDRERKGESLSVDDQKVIADFIDDAKRFVKQSDTVADELPTEFKDVRKRDKILSYLEQQAEEARRQWNAKRNIGFAQKITEPDIVLLAKMGMYHVAKQGVKLADFTETMVKEFGESIRPVIEEVYNRAKKMVGGTAKYISEDKLDRANDIMRNLSGQANHEKESVKNLSDAVKRAISNAKKGTFDADELQKIRDMSDEIANFPKRVKEITEDQRILQVVKSLAKKLSDVEHEKITPSEARREISALMRRLTQVADEGTTNPELPKLNTKAFDDLSYELLEKTKPSQAEKIATSYLKKNEARLDPNDVKMIRDLAGEVSKLSGSEQKAASQDLQALLNGFEKASIGRKISSVQYISMLLNPKTQIRNIVGNELMYRLERLAKFIGTPIDIAASKITGGPRTVTFKKGPMVWDNFFKPTKDYISGLGTGAKAGARGVNPEGLTSKYEIQGQAFRSKYNPLTYMEKALGASLQGFDYAAYNRAVNQRMGEMAYLDALNKGIKGADNIRQHMQTFMANLDEGVHNIAKEYGKFVTLQNDSVLSRGITGFRRGLNKITAGNEHFGVGSLVVPFSKTPANLLLRALDYSPAGILKAVKQSYEVLRKPNTSLTRADVIDSVSRALLGSGIGATAYWLADKGVLFGQSNKDSETRKLQNMVGIKDFQINGSALSRMIGAMVSGGNIDEAAKIRPGDTLWSYEWAQPSSMPMAVGANIYQGTKSGQSGLKTAGDAALAGLNTLYNSSVLSGIREAFQIPPGEDNAIKAFGLNLIKQAPSQFTPSILRNINSYLDERVKETYTPDELLTIVNPARSNIPGQSDQLPQRVDTFGKPITKPNSFLDVFVSPADRSKYQPTPEAQFVLDLLNETGDTRVAPRAVAKYLSGKDSITGLQRKVDLTPEQYVRLQTLVGEETAKRISKISPTLPTDKKIEAVIKAMDDAGKIGRNELKKELGLRLTK